MTKKAMQRAIARGSLTPPVVLRAINDIADMDWEVGAEDPSSGPYVLLPGHDLKPWMPGVKTRFYRDVARQLVVEALAQLCSRLSSLTVRHTPGGSPWEALTEEDHHLAMDRLRTRLIRRVRDAVRTDDVVGLIAMAENKAVEEIIADRGGSTPLLPEELERLLADIEPDVFVESDAFAKDLVDQTVPSARALRKAAAAVECMPWEVVRTQGGRWTARGGRDFNAALHATNGSDERSVARTLVARAVRYLTIRSTAQINELKRGACRFESDRAIHVLICDRIADAVRSEGYGGLGRLIGAQS